MISSHLLLWLIFIVVVAGALTVDLGLKSHRHRTAPMSGREAFVWCLVWIALALGFGAVVTAILGKQRGMEFFTAYLVEESLSVDNMFVFVVIFRYFAVPRAYQYRVLKWGILGAVVMRFILIFTGVTLLNMFHWMLYVFGAILLITAARMLKEDAAEIEPGKNPVLRLLRKFVPIMAEYREDRFFWRDQGRLWATPLFAALVVVEASDLLFAVDSIPAVLAVSNDPFVIFSSNVFAVLGLRALFFLVEHILVMFRFLRYGLAVVLAFIGMKMIFIDLYHVPIWLSLSVVVGCLGLSMLLSTLIKETKDNPT